MEDEVLSLCDRIREEAFSLHRHLRHGHVEKVYENGLAHRLRKGGLKGAQQHSLRVLDEDGTLLGELLADLDVEQRLIIELKACRSLVDDHLARLPGYWRASRIEHGQLISFRSPGLEVPEYVLACGD